MLAMNSPPRYIDPCKGFSSKMLIFSDHAGTHVDALVEGGDCAAKTPIDRLMGKAVGVDLAIADEVGNMQRPVYMQMLKSNIYLIENLINLHFVANQSFTFIGLPLKIKGATGSPIRAVAIVND